MKANPFRQTIKYFGPDLPLRIEWWRQARASAADARPLTYHPDYELHFIKQGRGKYIIGNRAYHFKSGHMVIIRPNEIHCLVPEPGHGIEKAGIMFSAEWQRDFFTKTGFTGDLPKLICLGDKQAVCIELIIKRILEENKQRAKGWRDMTAGLFRELLLWVNRVKHQGVKPVKEKPIFGQLRRHIETYYADPECTVISIARRFGYSRNYISALAREMTGLGLKPYLQQYRVIAARQLLELNPHIKVEAVARQVGFRQYRNFTRAFLAQTGITASRYRAFYHAHSAK